MSRYAIKCAPTAVSMIFALLCYGLSPASSNYFSWFGISEASAGQANLPDLVVTNVSEPPEHGNAGFSFWVNNTIMNIGSGNANLSTTQYLLVDQNIPPLYVLVGSRSVGNLKRGAIYTGPTVPVTIPLTTAPGPYYLIACADGTKSITESNESNNCERSAGTISVLVKVTLTADSSQQISAGGTVKVAWTEIANPSLSDWIALYIPGSSNINYVTSNYLNCSQTEPVNPIPLGSCQFTIPDDVAPGLYEFRLFAGPISAKSNAITIVAP